MRRSGRPSASEREHEEWCVVLAAARTRACLCVCSQRPPPPPAQGRAGRSLDRELADGATRRTRLGSSGAPSRARRHLTRRATRCATRDQRAQQPRCRTSSRGIRVSRAFGLSAASGADALFLCTGALDSAPSASATSETAYADSPPRTSDLRAK